MLIYSQKNSNR